MQILGIDYCEKTCGTDYYNLIPISGAIDAEPIVEYIKLTLSDGERLMKAFYPVCWTYRARHLVTKPRVLEDGSVAERRKSVWYPYAELEDKPFIRVFDIIEVDASNFTIKNLCRRNSSHVLVFKEQFRVIEAKAPRQRPLRFTKLFQEFMFGVTQAHPLQGCQNVLEMIYEQFLLGNHQLVCSDVAYKFEHALLTRYPTLRSFIPPPKRGAALKSKLAREYSHYCHFMGNSTSMYHV